MRPCRPTVARSLFLLLPAGLAMALSAPAAEPSAETRSEIQHVLGHLEKSGCQFLRNGKWYDGAQAKDHLNRKYDYLLKKKLVGKTEDFVRLAASQSSASGKPYQVRCKGVEPVPSEVWLNAELLRYREKVRAGK